MALSLKRKKKSVKNMTLRVYFFLINQFDLSFAVDFYSLTFSHSYLLRK